MNVEHFERILNSGRNLRAYHDQQRVALELAQAQAAIASQMEDNEDGGAGVGSEDLVAVMEVAGSVASATNLAVSDDGLDGLYEYLDETVRTNPGICEEGFTTTIFAEGCEDLATGEPESIPRIFCYFRNYVFR